MLQALVAYSAAAPVHRARAERVGARGDAAALRRGLGSLDVAMNSHGLEVERRYPQPIFASFHAGWSFGGLAGAAAGALAAVDGRRAPRAVRGDGGPARRGDAARRPLAPPLGRRPLGGDGHVPPAAAAAGRARAARVLRALRRGRDLGLERGLHRRHLTPAARSARSRSGRSPSRWPSRGSSATADHALGAGRSRGRGGALGAVALAAALLIRSRGSRSSRSRASAPVSPLSRRSIFRSAGSLPGIAPSVGLAALTTVGYSAFLVGPPTIGLLAEAVGLTGALTIVVAMLVVTAALAPRVQPAGAGDGAA